MDFQDVLERSHRSLSEFAQGAPEAFKALCSHADDITLANPFGPIARGWEQVSEALDYASSRFRDGDLDQVEEVARYANGDLVTLLERERWKARVGDRADVERFELRVTTTFRLEDGTWKIVARHADPLRTFDAEGPLRAS